MSSLPKIRIGMIGYGGMGKAHSYAYRAVNSLRKLPVEPHLQIISGRSPGAIEKAAEAFGFEEWTTDWRRIVERSDIDIIDICTPPGTHAEIAIAAAAAGKAVISEKPLATGYKDARSALQAVQKAKVLNAVDFNYRKLPAVSLMKRMIDDGAVGKVQLCRSIWMSDEFVDPTIPFDWRFERQMGGTTIADLGAHLIDMAQWMVGDIVEVNAQSETFVRERANAAMPGTTRRVEIDDASSALVRFENSARGIMEMTRSCVRRPCDFTVEVNGTKGTLHFNYARLNELLYGDGEDAVGLYGMRRIRAEHVSHPYASNWWAIGQGVGYGSSFVNHFGDLLEAWPAGPWAPDFAQGAKVQAVCDAMEKSAAERQWISISDIVQS
jgi:predicted dehydrogenase